MRGGNARDRTNIPSGELVFTGLIEGVGRVLAIEPRGGDARLRIEVGSLPFADVAIGESIAVNGVCLTVVEFDAASFAADASTETLALTTLGELAVDRALNLDRAMRPTDRLGGHLVSGHVDGVGCVQQVWPDARAQRWRFLAPAPLLRYIAVKGSICVDGVSLTVNRCEKTRFYVNMIPHTADATTLGRKRAGETVNIETDIIGKYVERLAAPYTGTAPAGGGLSRDLLSRHGFIK